MHRIIANIMTKLHSIISGLAISGIRSKLRSLVASHCLVVLPVAICALASLNQAQAAGLSLSQQATVAATASTVPWPTARTLAIGHPLGAQTLSIEKQERKNQLDVRWINVYQYNYAAQATRLLVMDLQENVIVKQTPIDSVHLPLNDVEIDFALSLIAQDTALLQRLKQDHSRRTPEPFVSIYELDLKASIYEPLQAEHPCQTQRCALVSLFDQTNTVFAAEPIVNLSAMSVTLLSSQ